MRSILRVFLAANSRGSADVAKSDSASYMRWLVVVVVLYAAIAMLRSAYVERLGDAN